MGIWFMQKQLTGKKIIITGASSGIGEKLVWRIAEAGGTPLMIARSISKLTAIKKRIWEHYQIESYVYEADLLVKKDREAVIEFILIEHEQIHGLINNAGIGKFAHFLEMCQQEMDNMFELNVHALIQMSKRFLAHFDSFNEGHIVNIASQAGKIATPKAAIYSSTKHAVIGFSNGLRLELKKTNVFVTVVNLGPVQTDFFQTADPNGTYQENVSQYMLNPDKVAIKIVNHLFESKREINLPLWMEIGSRLYQLFPVAFERILQKQFTKK